MWGVGAHGLVNQLGKPRHAAVWPGEFVKRVRTGNPDYHLGPVILDAAAVARSRVC